MGSGGRTFVTFIVSYCLMRRVGNGKGNGGSDTVLFNPPTTTLHPSTLLIPVTLPGCTSLVAHPPPLTLTSCKKTVASRNPAATTLLDNHSTLVTAECAGRSPRRDQCVLWCVMLLSLSLLGRMGGERVQWEVWPVRVWRPEEVPRAKSGCGVVGGWLFAVEV